MEKVPGEGSSEKGNVPSLREITRIILTGWKVLFAELKWSVIKICRQWEIKQLKKRLDQEYTNLGRCIYDQIQGFPPGSLDTSEPETDLALKQISFLKDEIAHLEKELVEIRQELIQRRKQKFEEDQLA
ncbi:hypothetical protein KFV02_05835 [Desulfohalobiaceae bacterium Ax17]|jgi:hypothetical protein|uniref:hypothetical protein n=1 Tax=Desulfovulcanus ferrireducens TaxID=2831190 RepID=UPI00207BA774|nr:hypothetical protein [Desulfovulcanus ferrireducens]MBT8763449.1 hypothetical protein [Desulfovulcanus ferrireducens]